MNGETDFRKIGLAEDGGDDGVMRSLTSAATTAPNAEPTTTATASSPRCRASELFEATHPIYPPFILRLARISSAVPWPAPNRPFAA